MAARMKILLTAGITLLIISGANGILASDDGVSVQALVDHAAVLIGDRIKLVIDVKYSPELEIDLPKFKENKIGDFEIKDSGREVKKGLFGADELKYWYYIAAYSAGKHQVGPIEVKYRKRSVNDWKSVRTGALNLTIESVLPKGKMPEDIKDIKGPFGYFEINWLIISGIAVLLIVITTVIIFNLRKKPLPVKLPHETALEELEVIRGNFLNNSDVKEYYTGVSDCVRRYIERSFKLKAPEMTTEEFLDSLRESTVLPLDQKDLLKDFLNACDLVKFAKYTPQKGEMEAVFLAAKNFIDTSKIQRGRDVNF